MSRETRVPDKKRLSDMTKMTVGAERSLRRAIVERHRQQISVHGYRTDWASACCVKVFGNARGMVVQRRRSQARSMTFIAMRERQLSNADFPRAKG